MQNKNKPVVLLILDGWGYREEKEFNAIAMANTPNWDHLWSQHPHTLISGSGQDVGLPQGQMGNSEVGHLCMGAGRVIYQDLERINHSIEQGDFNQNPTLVKAMESARHQNKKVHLMGLLSAGGVHSHQDHFIAALNLAKQLKIQQVFVHAFLDGRDTPPKSAASSLELIDHWFKDYGHGQIASLCGRYYAMDRDQRYDRSQLAYDLLTEGAPHQANTAMEGLQAAYDRNQSDEFVLPCSILHEGKPVLVEDGDVIVFMNFRSDRARQLSYAFTRHEWHEFPRKHHPQVSHFVTLTQYDKNLQAEVVFPAIEIPNTLGSWLAQHHLKQLRLAETEKYAHVTFFFNGGVEKPNVGEDRQLIPSPKVATYDLKPQMSAQEVTDALVEAIRGQTYDVIICNYANPDMVGHTGNIPATVQAIETIDQCLNFIMKALKEFGGEMLITADHGNAEMMVDPKTQQAHTAHTTELVPLIYYGPRKCDFNTSRGQLSDIAPTLLNLLGLPIPQEMTGQGLLQ